MTQSAELGKLGEGLAKNFLKESGYKIIKENFRTKYGEIDLIAEDKNTIVFVEVKTRNSDTYGVPQLSVNFYKQKHLTRAALIFIKKNALNTNYRFDIISIFNGKVEHIKNVFAPSNYTV
ncbi:MAG: YraN family protein [Elusimicrobia bacterium]|nr:YraN family protein [Elusimicrobiota bacterium]